MKLILIKKNNVVQCKIFCGVKDIVRPLTREKRRKAEAERQHTTQSRILTHNGNRLNIKFSFNVFLEKKICQFKLLPSSRSSTLHMDLTVCEFFPSIWRGSVDWFSSSATKKGPEKKSRACLGESEFTNIFCTSKMAIRI